MMEKKNLPQPTDTIERMAAKIDEIYDRLNFIETLMSDLGPGLGKVAKDLSPTIKDLRELYEKDETLELIMKVGDNIPTFLTLLNLMGTVKGMLEDLAPAIQKISKDTQPTIRDLREKFEKDETLELIMKVGDNIPTFLTLLNLMGTVKGMLEDLAPALVKISKDIQPTIRDLREKFERDETLELIMKLGDNIPVFVMLKDLSGKPEIHDFILKTLENIKIFRGLGDMLSVFDNLMNFLQELNKAKTIDYTTKILLSKEINYLIIGMDKCIFNAMKDIKENPIKPGIKNLISAVRDPEVQKGILIMTKFAKWLPGSLSEAEKEVDGIITGS